MKANKTTEDIYFIDEDFIITRYYGILPNELPGNGIWVLQNKRTGEIKGFSQYRYDLLDKYPVRC